MQRSSHIRPPHISATCTPAQRMLGPLHEPRASSPQSRMTRIAADFGHHVTRYGWLAQHHCSRAWMVTISPDTMFKAPHERSVISRSVPKIQQRPARIFGARTTASIGALRSGSSSAALSPLGQRFNTVETGYWFQLKPTRESLTCGCGLCTIAAKRYT
jgi:hypothetical protein